MPEFHATNCHGIGTGMPLVTDMLTNPVDILLTAIPLKDGSAPSSKILLPKQPGYARKPYPLSGKTTPACRIIFSADPTCQ